MLFLNEFTDFSFLLPIFQVSSTLHKTTALQRDYEFLSPLI